ncbi:hypothetical protein [Heliophilum fasciatum]|uniref:Holin family Hol44 protein (Superfamily V) n=1 Tax=Heliophilum fasciatum TaxID=35700 RepID=A0A4R2REJ7_9FIRM|nr:hypothetical protein [Heliophilum fasciatum]MCW2279119.1 hypothetical protein [Heliophilum fasciatum]TCP61253.1 hypothetical protein EDD73_1296 [Heliophilum fasciatum]
MTEVSFVVALLIAVGQVAKLYIDTKYIPLVTLALGILAGVTYVPAETIQAGILNGVAFGLAANGLFDVTKILHPDTTMTKTE